jgi:zeaxanthin glucosyltransferase
LILMDDTLGHYYACLAGKAVIIQVSTRLSPRKHPSAPPLNSFYIPQRHPANSLITNGQWWWHICRRRLNEGVQRLVFRGRSEVDFLRRYEQGRGIDWQEIRNENVAFYDAVAGLSTLVMAPKSLEFEHIQSSADEHYLYIPDQRSEQAYFSEKYVQAIEQLTYRKRVNETRIVYAALGTLSSGQSSQARQLLMNVIEALRGNETLDVVIATGGLTLSLSDLPTNIYCLPVVPQLDMLKHCDLMITHGGFGSIKECVSGGVPMLVYPLNTNVDQPGNSARVVGLQLGLRGKVTETPTTIRYKVHSILNTPIYKKNCQLMKQRLYGDEQQVDAVLKSPDCAGTIEYQGQLKMGSLYHFPILSALQK